MINTLKIFNELKQTMDPTAAEKIVDVIGSVYEELKNSVTKTEFNELKEIVRDLAEAQKRTEIRVEELAVAQKNTEIRLEKLTESVDKLTERVDALAGRMDQLTERVDALAGRMDQLTERVDALAGRMDQLTERVDALTVNMSRLERKVEDLVGEMKVFKRELGGLSHTVGYRLEDEAMKSLPALLKQDHSITVKGRLIRDYVEISPKRYVELNIWGHGLKDGTPVEIIGEAKSQLKKRDVDQFIQTIKNLEPVINRPIVPVVITYQTSPDVRQYVRSKEMILYFSYEL